MRKSSVLIRNVVIFIMRILLTNVKQLELLLTRQRDAELFAGADLVLDGTDNFETRYAVNDACAALGLPYVWASVYRTQAQVSVFWNAPPAPFSGTDLRDPRLSPAYADLPEGLAPAYLCTAGFDPLRDEGEHYARLLEKAGVPVTMRRFEDAIHGFFNVTGAGRSAPAAVAEIVEAVRAGLH